MFDTGNFFCVENFRTAEQDFEILSFIFFCTQCEVCNFLVGIHKAVEIAVTVIVRSQYDRLCLLAACSVLVMQSCSQLGYLQSFAVGSRQLKYVQALFSVFFCQFYIAILGNVTAPCDSRTVFSFSRQIC